MARRKTTSRTSQTAPELEAETTTTETLPVGEADEFANSLLPEDVKLEEGKMQAGVIVEYESSGGPGQLVITKLPLTPPGARIFITAPIRITGEKLVKLLDAKKVQLPGTLRNVLLKIEAGLDAFYFEPGEKGTLLVAIHAGFSGGLIDSLVNNTEAPPDEVAMPTGWEKMSDTDKGKAENLPYKNYLAKLKELEAKNAVPVSEIFDLKRVSVRVVQCSEAARPTLKKYLLMLKH